MTSATLYYGDVVQILFVAVSLVLVLVSTNAYRRRQEGRYLFLMLAFVFLCVVAADTAFFELYTGVNPAAIQLALLYLNPSLEILMVVCFLLAVVWSRAVRGKVVVIALTVIMVIGLAAAVAYESSASESYVLSGQSSTSLPAGCARPDGGFLIIATSMGYNDSIGHGAPTANWPVLDVTRGSNVSIAVCNLASFPVGFQITHYLDDQLVSVSPGNAIEVSFMADEVGVFFIYCSVFNPIHLFLQSGKVVVS